MTGVTGCERPGDPNLVQDGSQPLGNIYKACTQNERPAKGLAILPVVRTVVLESLQKRLPPNEAILLAKLQDEAGTIAAPGPNTPVLKEYKYVLRTLPAGYLYIFKPGKPKHLMWESYSVDEGSVLRPMHDVGSPARFIVIDHQKHDEVWMAFSYYRWTDAVMAKYAANKDSRSRRMLKVNVKELAGGALTRGFHMGRDIKTVVANYAPKSLVSKLNKNIDLLPKDKVPSAFQDKAGKESLTWYTSGSGNLFTRIVDFNEGATRLVADKLANEMTEKGGVIIPLDDSLGVAFKVKTSIVAEVDSKQAYIAENLRKYMVAGHILDAKKSFDEHGRGREWSTRYEKHYNHKVLDILRRDYEKDFAKYTERIDRMSDDAADLYGPLKALNAWWSDFDPANDQSAIDRQIATALCICPAYEENDKLCKAWDGWMKENPANPDAVIWGALTALDAKLGEFIFGKSWPMPDQGKTDKVPDIIKNFNEAWALYKANNNRKELKKRNHSDSLQSTLSDVASHLIRVKLNQPERYSFVFEEKFMKTIAARVDVTIVARSEQITKIQLEGLLSEAVGTSKPKILQTLIDDDVLVARNSMKQPPVVLWLPEELSKLPPFPVGELASTPAPNPYQKMLNFISENTGMLSWVGVILQSFNMANSAGAALNENASSKDKFNAPFGILSGVLGIASLIFEIRSGRQATIAAAVSKFRAGKLSMLAAAVDGVNAICNSYRQWNAGNKPSMLSYGGAAVFIGLSAVLSARLASVVVAPKLLLMGLLVNALLIVLGQGAIWFAEDFAYTEFEIWIKKSVLGNNEDHKKYDDEQEMTELMKILYGSAMKINLDRSPPSKAHGVGTIYWFSMGLPGANDANTNSALYCKITLCSKKKANAREIVSTRKIIFEDIIRPVVYTGKSINPKHISLVEKKVEWHKKPTIKKGDSGLELEGKFLLDRNPYETDEIEVEIVYLPDRKARPDLVLPLNGEFSVTKPAQE
jgi:hypothetical protein